MTDSQPRRGRPARYTRDQVLRTALQLLEREPAEPLSLRQLADELEMSPMTLYGYVTDLNDLLEGAAGVAFAQIHAEPDPTAEWDQRIKAVIAELYAICRRYPRLCLAPPGERVTAPALYQTRNWLFAELRDSGFDETEALHALGVLCYYPVAFAVGQAWAELPPDLPKDTAPRLTAIADRYPEHVSDAAFAYGLDNIIGGLRRSRAERRAGPAGSRGNDL